MKNDFEHQQEWWCPYSHEQHNGEYECVIYNIPKKCDGEPGLYELCPHWRRMDEVEHPEAYEEE